MRVVKVSRSADDKQLSTLPYPLVVRAVNKPHNSGTVRALT